MNTRQGSNPFARSILFTKELERHTGKVATNPGNGIGSALGKGARVIASSELGNCAVVRLNAGCETKHKLQGVVFQHAYYLAHPNPAVSRQEVNSLLYQLNPV